MQVEYRDSEESKSAGIAYHMAITSEWEGRANREEYVPSAYEADGFIHCTNGLDLLTEVGNMFYTGSPDPRTILVIDINTLNSELRYDDPEEKFPHIYGPINASSVIAELPVERSSDGTFTKMGN